MMAALIRGAPSNTILGNFTCEGSPLIRDALVIPTALDDALVARLGHTPDEIHLERVASLLIQDSQVEDFVIP
jgi:hypothetical protein